MQRKQTCWLCRFGFRRSRLRLLQKVRIKRLDIFHLNYKLSQTTTSSCLLDTPTSLTQKYCKTDLKLALPSRPLNSNAMQQQFSSQLQFKSAMMEGGILQRMAEHYQTLRIANRKALALFRRELRQISITNPPPVNKSEFNSGQETKAMSTIDERSKAAQKDSESKYQSRKVSDDLEILFEDDQKQQFNSIPRNENFLQKLCSSNRGWTITDTRESLVSFERVQPNCTDFQHQ